MHVETKDGLVKIGKKKKRLSKCSQISMANLKDSHVTLSDQVDQLSSSGHSLTYTQPNEFLLFILSFI
jgi:hypothetical protein